MTTPPSELLTPTVPGSSTNTVADANAANAGPMGAGGATTTPGDVASPGEQPVAAPNEAASAGGANPLGPEPNVPVPAPSPNPSTDPGTSEGETTPGGASEPTEPTEEQVDPGAGPENETSLEPAPLSFATDIWPLWSATRDPVFVYRGMGSYSGCADETTPCHGATSAGAGLSMVDVQTAYDQMMDTPSASGICAGTQRVVVGDPDQSCLVLFYEGRLGPQDLDWVTEEEIELMREWIRQGALP